MVRRECPKLTKYKYKIPLRRTETRVKSCFNEILLFKVNDQSFWKCQGISQARFLGSLLVITWSLTCECQKAPSYLLTLIILLFKILLSTHKCQGFSQHTDFQSTRCHKRIACDLCQFHNPFKFILTYNKVLSTSKVLSLPDTELWENITSTLKNMKSWTLKCYSHSCQSDYTPFTLNCDGISSQAGGRFHLQCVPLPSIQTCTVR
jgi:hypothetical protein